MPAKKKRKNEDIEKKNEDQDLQWEENELGISDEDNDYDEIVLNRKEAEDLLEKIEKLKQTLKDTDQETTA
jgi:hypothetical protein